MYSNEARYQSLLKLQHNPANIRNISIIAHVDHGIFPLKSIKNP